MVKIVGLSGSPRKDGNTEILVKEALKAAKSRGAETEFVSLAGKEIQPCQACYTCRLEESKGECAIEDDLAEIFEKFKEADGIIIGSPVYFLTVTAQLKALFDRSLVLRYGKGKVKGKPGIKRTPDFLLSNKAGGAISVAGSTGQQLTILEILKWMVFQDMVVVGNEFDLGTNARAGLKGGARKDKAALQQARHTGLRVAEIAKRLNPGKITG
ncbi:MAG: flavodoxin family protein [Candidatus Omnitrophica bacterium]|nr:flavodoxin family protein [Candidatus Omnitrophota bacterium]